MICTSKKSNNIKLSIDIESVLSELGVSCKTNKEFVGLLTEYLENNNIHDIIIRVGRDIEKYFSDKYHSESAYEKYISSGDVCGDEKYSLYYGIIYQLLSKKHDRKIQLNVIFKSLKDAEKMLGDISKAFPSELVSEILKVGFACESQEKNIAEYFYSANFPKGVFPVFDCLRYGSQAELLIAILRVSRVLPLECVTFICHDNGNICDLFECAEIIGSDK